MHCLRTLVMAVVMPVWHRPSLVTFGQPTKSMAKMRSKTINFNSCCYNVIMDMSPSLRYVWLKSCSVSTEAKFDNILNAGFRFAVVLVCQRDCWSRTFKTKGGRSCEVSRGPIQGDCYVLSPVSGQIVLIFYLLGTLQIIY